MKYCEHCGQKMLTEEKFCPACGAPTAHEEAVEKQKKAEEAREKSTRKVLCIVAGILMLATCLLLAALAYLGLAFYAIYGLFYIIVLIAGAYGGTQPPTEWNAVDPHVFFIAVLLPLLWIIPMAIIVLVKGAKGDKISEAFKICTLIFCSVPAGIILLFIKNEED